MDRGTTPQVPGCEGLHAANVSRPRPGGLAWAQVATGNGSVEGEAEIAERPSKNSAGLLVPCASPWKLGEREGTLLQSWVLEGGEEVRLPYG